MTVISHLTSFWVRAAGEKFSVFFFNFVNFKSIGEKILSSLFSSPFNNFFPFRCYLAIFLPPPQRGGGANRKIYTPDSTYIENKVILIWIFLNDEYVEVVDPLDVVGGADLRHVQRVQEPTQVHLVDIIQVVFH